MTDVAALEKSFRAVLSSACISTPTVSSHFSNRASFFPCDFLEAPEEIFSSFLLFFAASFKTLRNGPSSFCGWLSTCRARARRVTRCCGANGEGLVFRRHDAHTYERLEVMANAAREVEAIITRRLHETLKDARSDEMNRSKVCACSDREFVPKASRPVVYLSQLSSSSHRNPSRHPRNEETDVGLGLAPFQVMMEEQV